MKELRLKGGEGKEEEATSSLNGLTTKKTRYPWARVRGEADLVARERARISLLQRKR